MHLNCTKLYTVLLCFFIAPLSLLAKDKFTKEEAQQMGIKKPLVFVENKGQVTNQYFKHRKDVQYELYGNGMNVFVGNGQLHYQFNKLNTSKIKNAKPHEPQVKINSYRACRMDISLVGANKNAQVITEDKQLYHESYRNGERQIRANSYGKVTYKNIYPNIDWVLYTKNDKLEYDFVVHPGGNAKDIKIRYNGAKKLALQNGSLAIESSLGRIVEEKPYAYNAGSKKAVASNFVLHNDLVSFNVGQSTGTVVIDPQVSWVTYYGGNGSDQSNNAIADNSGNIYTIGFTSSISNIVTIGTYDSTFGGGTYDCFIAQYNPSGSLVWGAYLGSVGNDLAQDVSYDGTYLYIAGYTSSNQKFATKDAYDTTYHGGTGSGGTGDAFLAKYATTDSLIWCTYYGGTQSDGAYGVACDPSGNVYFCGQTSSRTVMATSDGYDTSFGGRSDIFLAKFSGSGSRLWATYYGDTGTDQAYDVAVDKAGNPYIIGNATSPSLATSGAHQTSFTFAGFNTQSALIVKFTKDGARRWATYYGNGATLGYTVAFDTLNNLYCAGYTNSTNAIASPGAQQSSFGGGFGFTYDIFLAKFDTSGRRQWGTYYGGTGSDINYSGIAFDAWNNMIFTGHTSSPNSIAITGIDSANAAQQNYNGGRDINITKFTPQGQLLWGTYWGGQRDDEGRGCVYLASNDGIYVTGFTSSPDSFTTANGLDTIYGSSGTGQFDAFIMKLNPDTFVVINQPYVDTILCPGSTFTVNYTASHSFNSGNTFSVLLSSSTGSFTSPTTIGSVTASTSGSITCTIPIGTSAGTGYKIRIYASDPQFYSPTDYYNIQITTSVPTNPSISSNSPVCVGDSIKLSASTTAPPNNTFSWTGPGGFTSSLQNPFRTNATIAMAGTYKVVVAHSGCPADSTTATVSVNNTYPSQPKDSTNAPICAGTDLYLFTRTTTSGVTYAWSGPGGFSSTLQNPVITAAPSTATGIYYTVVSLNGCKARDSVYAEIDVPSTPNINITALADTICAGDNAQFFSSILFGGSTPGYQWVVNSSPEIGAISSVWGSPYLNTQDTIYCILTSSAYCVNPVTDTSNKIIINILPIVPPTAVVTVSPNNTFTPGMTLTFTANVINGGPAPTYQWRVNGVDVPGATDYIYSTNTLNYNDKVTVMVHSNAMCVSPDSALGNIISVNVGNVTSSSSIGLYPNPNNGSFTVSGTFNSLNHKDATIEILNVMGRVVYSDKTDLHNGMIQKRIDIGSDVPAGMYMLRLKADEEIQTQQFVIKR